MGKDGGKMSKIKVKVYKVPKPVSPVPIVGKPLDHISEDGSFFPVCPCCRLPALQFKKDVSVDEHSDPWMDIVKIGERLMVCKHCTSIATFDLILNKRDTEWCYPKYYPREWEHKLKRQ